ncbi:TolC family protein [bacterium]|nr:TolC family protein [bacterium]
MKKLLFTILIFAFAASIHAEDSKNSWSSPGVPKDPGKFWNPPSGEPPKLTGATPVAPPPEIQNKRDWSLADLIDFALQTSYTTRETWNNAKARAAEMNSKKGEYWPDVELEGRFTRIKSSAVGGRFTFEQNSFDPIANINWVLFDFGRRKGDIDEARQNLVSADWLHNSEIQNVILQVQQAFYAYIGSRSLLKSQEAAVQRAQTNLDAAKHRHDAGLATIADELQAQTSLAQAQLDYETTQGELEILRGTLAVAIGIPPSQANFDVVDELPAELPIDQISKDVQAMVQQGIKRRPELLAARAEALAAEAHVRSVRAERYPIIETANAFDRLYYISPDESHANNYSLSLSIRFPLFDGFSRKWDVEQAKAEAESSKARAASLQQQVGLQVWRAYFALDTAAEQIRSTKRLLESAEQSFEVASGRYREGVGTILDTLAAQNALEDARAQDVRSRTLWLLALAQLYHNMGTLGLPDQDALVKTTAGQDVNQ